MKKNKWLIFILITVILFALAGIPWAGNKLTYIENTSMNVQADSYSYVLLQNSGDTLTQEFEMPYDIIEGISVQIGTFSRDNNSLWRVMLMDEDHKAIYANDFSMINAEDNSYYKIKFKHKLRVTRGKKYELAIVAEEVNDLNNVAFYTSQNSTLDGKMLINNQKSGSDLCFKVYGGDKDYWWLGFSGVAVLYLIVLFWRCYHVEKQGRNIKNELYVQAMLIGLVSFLLLVSFINAGQFTDEMDNMYGGMAIANGKVLYRDYVTQHTPVMYYLCSLFSLLGAGSVQQFRLSYYLLEAVIWALVYVRYSEKFGKKQITLLVILETVGLSSLVSPYGSQILSDGFQGILTVVLVLEYLSFIKDKKLEWDRCVLVAICLWGSFGAAFVAAYALVWIVLGVVISEACEWKKTGFNLKSALKRYYKLLISIMIPLTGAVIYFKVNHSLKIAFDQFYRFNRAVYSQYYGMGENMIQPFINGVQNFFAIISNSFNAIVTGTASNVTILQLVIMGMAVSILIILCGRKRYQESIILLLVMICSATRGYDLHGIAAWYTAILIISLYLGLIEEKMSKVGKPILGLCGIVLLSTYIISGGDNLLYTQDSVSETESKVIELTENDSDKNIYLDLYSSSSLYYAYKGRYAVNRVTYMLPWYMDWYEKDAIEDLLSYNPEVVVYNEDEGAWGYTHYAPAFVAELNEYYHRLSDNNENAGYNIWVRNE